ncbi:adenosylmethionine decarboxylase, partial [Flavobacterium beibuense]|uniref:adenosylmethionine decarboxylase n=1 Tax=Flavobacterium beibuense TaxID=657326 RepID=UPI003A8EC104
QKKINLTFNILLKEGLEALGRQILVEYYDCDSSKINDVEFIEQAMLDGTKEAHATIISHNFHKFSPYGVSGVVVIAESHVAIHTWPEYNYAAVDIFTCGDTIDPWIIQEFLKEAFESKNISSMEMKRGMFKVPQGQKLLFKPATNLVNT